MQQKRSGYAIPLIVLKVFNYNVMLLFIIKQSEFSVNWSIQLVVARADKLASFLFKHLHLVFFDGIDSPEADVLHCAFFAI